MWFACIHYWATDVFSMDPPRDYINNTEQNQITYKRLKLGGGQAYDR
jgi:hypothetical protein